MESKSGNQSGLPNGKTGGTNGNTGGKPSSVPRTGIPFEKKSIDGGRASLPPIPKK